MQINNFKTINQTDSGSLNTAVVVLGKFLVTSSFYIVYVMTSELFPTAVRHTTSAIVSGFSRVGGILTSFLIYAGLWRHISYLSWFTTSYFNYVGYGVVLTWTDFYDVIFHLRVFHLFKLLFIKIKRWVMNARFF